MDIHILPSHIANMIAAGEVVQRPASVVKELMENSVDALATKVQVLIVDAGRTSIQVIDNGCGMNPDEAVLCFQRHATSKIATAQDLENISTFGFRGEALPSIAAVSEVTLKTRTADSEMATQVTVEGATVLEPGQQDIASVAAPVGTSVMARNLFYNTPARRKFLKSDASELKAIIAEFIRVALTRPDIAFSLTSNGKEVMVLGSASSIKYRIRDIFGETSVSELLEMDARSQYVSMCGFISRPDSGRKTTANQFFFVNGRFFRSPYLHKSVMKAYENLIPEGTAPSYFIYIDIDPGAVDVNVHPTKTEIKFEDDNVLFAMLNAAVKEALGRSSFGARLDFEAGELPQLHNVGPSFEEYKGTVTQPVTGPSGDFNPFDGDGFPNEKWYGEKPEVKKQDFSKLFDSVPMTSIGQAFGKEHGQAGQSLADTRKFLISGRYILTSGQSGILLVDTQRAFQRIFYDQFIDILGKNGTAAQGRIFSVEVEVGPENMPVLAANADLLNDLGISLSPIGPGTVRVDTIPEGFIDDGMSVSAFIYEAVNALSEETGSLASSVYAPLATKLSSSAARNASFPKNGNEAQTLMDKLYSCDNPDYAPDGHKIVSILKHNDLENLLK